MKTQILVLDLKEWNFKTEKGQEIEGTSALFILDDYDFQRSTLKGDMLEMVKKTKLPAIFDAEVKAIQKYNNGKAQLKYEVSYLKFVKELPIFVKAGN